MPIHNGKDAKGCYWEWGDQHKYYYDPRNKKESTYAYERALQQARAIYSHGYVPSNFKK